MPGKDELPDWQLYCLMIAMLVFGTANTLVMKYQDEFKVASPESRTGRFTHPYFQCANMFLGELMCLFVYFIKKYVQKKQGVGNQSPDGEVAMVASPGTQLAIQTNLKTNINPFWFALPAAFDTTASSLMFVGLTQCAASVYQMMRGAIVLITALFSVIFLKRKQYAHHIISLIIIVSGVTLVGYSGIVAAQNKKPDDSPVDPDDPNKKEAPPSTTIFGVVVLIVAQCFTGGQFITEEKLFDGYYLDPLFVVGMEGFFGTLYFIILLPIFQHIECHRDGICSDSGFVENSILAFHQLRTYPALLGMSIGIIVSISSFNACGVSITKYASAAQRSTVDTCRTLFIWVISLAVGTETFNWGELFAFFLLVFGTMVYNEILIVPIDFMRRNTTQYRLAREGDGRLDDPRASRKSLTQDGNMYVATSPHACYDQGRNVRNIEKKMNERDNLIYEHQANQMYNDDEDFIANASEQPPSSQWSGK